MPSALEQNDGGEEREALAFLFLRGTRAGYGGRLTLHALSALKRGEDHPLPQQQAHARTPGSIPPHESICLTASHQVAACGRRWCSPVP
jgi:hypothetical protein